MGIHLILVKNDALACNSNQIFRHSFTDYYLYQIATKELTKLFDFQIKNQLSHLMVRKLLMQEKTTYLCMT
jgi:hypothetical protein